MKKNSASIPSFSTFNPSHDKINRNRSCTNVVDKNLMPLDQENDLHRACKEAQWELVEILLERNPEYASQHDNNGCLPLHLACQNSSGADCYVMEKLLNENPRAAKVKDNNGCLPLHLACQNSVKANLDIVKQLLKGYPIGVKVKDKNGCLPLHAACQNSAGANLDIVKTLLNIYPLGARKKDNNACLPLHAACQNSPGANSNVVNILLNWYPRGIEEKDDNGRLPLHLACQNIAGADSEVVNRLLSSYTCGAKVKDNNGCLPLCIACINGANLDIVKRLLKEYPQARDDHNVKEFLEENINDLCGQILRDIECKAPPDIQLVQLMLILCKEYPSQKVKGDRVKTVLRSNADEVCKAYKLTSSLDVRDRGGRQFSCWSSAAICVGLFFGEYLTINSNLDCQYSVTTLTLTDKCGSAVTYNLYHGIWKYQTISKVFNLTAEELCCDTNDSNMYDATDRNSNAFDIDSESKSYNKSDGKTESKSCYINDGYLYSYSDANASSIGYNNVILDPAWIASRAFSILAVIFGLLVPILCPLLLHISPPAASYMILIASLLQSLTFLFFGSNGCAEFPEKSYETNALITASLSGKCDLAAGAKKGIAAAAIWFVCWLGCAPIGKYYDTIRRLYSSIRRCICCENRRAVQKFIDKMENQACVQNMDDKLENQGSGQNNETSQEVTDDVKI